MQRKTPYFWKYPIFPYFAASLSGAVAAGNFPNLAHFSTQFLWLAAAILILDFTCSTFFYFGISSAKIRFLKRFFRACALFCACIFIFFKQNETPPAALFAPEISPLTLRILETSESSSGGRYGVAEILESRRPDTIHRKIWFNIPLSKKSKKAGIKTPKLRAGDIFKAASATLSPVVKNPPLSWQGYKKQESTQTDFNTYLLNRFVFFKAVISPEDIEISSRAPKPFGEKIADYMRKKLASDRLEFRDAPAAYDALQAMVLGDKSKLTPERKQTFKEAGAMHIFAVSGLHVGIVALALLYLCAIARIPICLRALVALPLLFLYVLACGLPPSAVRAFIMVSVFWIAMSAGRNSASINALMLSATVAISLSPSVVFGAGFQLSYAVVASMLLFSFGVCEDFRNAFFKRHYFGRFNPAVDKIFDIAVGGICISVGAACAAFPISSYWFGAVSIGGIILSPAFVFLAGFVVLAAMAGIVLPSFAGTLCLGAGAYITSVMVDIAQWTSDHFNFMCTSHLQNGYACAAATALIMLLFSFSIKIENAALRFAIVPAIVSIGMFTLWILQ